MKTAAYLGHHEAFGWVLTHMGLAAGGAYSYILPRDTEREQLPAVSLWTKGRVQGINLATGSAIDDRAPGVLTSDLTRVVRAGRFVLTAQEDSEWWCVAAKTNRGQLPRLRKLQLTAGQAVTLDEGQKILVCSGSATFGALSLNPGASVLVTDTGELRASSDLLGLFFDRVAP